MAWDKTKPEAGIKARDLDDKVRVNNAALEAAIAAHCDFATGGSQTGLLNIGAHKIYSGATAPTTKEDGTTAFDSSDYGRRIWLDTNFTPGVFKVLTAAATWTPISELLGDWLKLRQKSGDPTHGTDYGCLYTKDVSGKTELFYKDEAGNVKQLTADGKLNVAANEAVLLTGAQTIADVKTFSSIPVLPASSPTNDNQATRKKYVDDYVNAHGVVQIVHTQDGAYATGTGTIPRDDTIPQSSEGTQFMSLAITPKSTTNKLKIDVVWNGVSSVGSADITVALFKDSDTDALACASDVAYGQNDSLQIVFTYYMTAGSVSQITFKVRAGMKQAGTTTFNGEAGARVYGGKMASSITITELKG